MDRNLFMICNRLNRQAFSNLPPGFIARTLRRDELGFWQAMPFDDEYSAESAVYMDEFFRTTYAAKEELFFQRVLVVCDQHDQIVGTCFLWQAYDLYLTVHWFKVVKAYENRGIGRALLALVFKNVTDSDLPIYLHTQPESFRAVKLYSDFGFELLTDLWIGQRENHLAQSLAFLKEQMPPKDYAQLRFAEAPAEFIAGLAGQTTNQF